MGEEVVSGRIELVFNGFKQQKKMFCQWIRSQRTMVGSQLNEKMSSKYKRLPPATTFTVIQFVLFPI
uniref:Uncharacterized protein n=1 Tax=Caenorhabditis japonica TaxID=281687 RepID=A0A8R1EE75_CAEJA